MIRFILMMFCGLALTACSPHDQRYYKMHPQAIEKALRECSSKSSLVTCEQLQTVAYQVNQLIYLLQSNQQAFGLSILQLQSYIADHDTETKRDALNERLAIIRWLQAPGA